MLLSFYGQSGDNRRDLDNISSLGRKFILDALVKAGKLENDNRNNVIAFKDTFQTIKNQWKINIKITEIV